MRWAIKVGRYAGIDVYLHVTFLLFLAFVATAQGVAEGTLRAAWSGAAFFAAVFLCVLLHEFGHAMAARRYGIRTRDITLLPIGGVARLERLPDRPLQELWVALAGPAVNVGIAAVLAALLLVSSHPLGLPGLDWVQASFVPRLLLVNVILVLFNMVPAFPMDGGRVLRALLALRMDYARATRIAAALGQAVALVFAGIGLFGLLGGQGNPTLLFIAFFVWIGASHEAGAAQLRSALGGARVGDAMLTQYSVLRPDESLGRAVDLVLAGSQQDFPVAEGRRVVGVLTRQRLLAALSEHGRGYPIAAAMDRNFLAANLDQPLEDLLTASAGHPPRVVPVLVRGELAGLLTWENVTDFILIRSALRASRGRAGEVPPVLPGPPVS